MQRSAGASPAAFPAAAARRPTLPAAGPVRDAPPQPPAATTLKSGLPVYLWQTHRKVGESLYSSRPFSARRAAKPKVKRPTYATAATCKVGTQTPDKRQAVQRGYFTEDHAKHSRRQALRRSIQSSQALHTRSCAVNAARKAAMRSGCPEESARTSASEAELRGPGGLPARATWPSPPAHNCRDPKGMLYHICDILCRTERHSGWPSCLPRHICCLP